MVWEDGGGNPASYPILNGRDSRLVPESSRLNVRVPSPRCQIFPVWAATNQNRRDAPRQAPYFLSRRRQKVSKNAFPCGEHALARLRCAEESFPPSNPAETPWSQSRLRSRVVGRMPLCNSALRSQRLWWFKGFKTKKRRRSLRIAGCRNNHHPAQWSQRRRAAPTTPRVFRTLRPPHPNAGGSPGSFGFFSEPNQKSNSFGGTRSADFESPLAPLFQGRKPLRLRIRSNQVSCC